MKQPLNKVHSASRDVLLPISRLQINLWILMELTDCPVPGFVFRPHFFKRALYVFFFGPFWKQLQGFLRQFPVFYCLLKSHTSMIL